MKRPLAGLALTFALGIWLGANSHWTVTTWLWAAWVALLMFPLLYRTKFSLVSLLVLVTAAGATAYRHATTISARNHITRLVELRDQNISLRGLIVSDPGFRPTDDTVATESFERHSFRLRLQALQVNDSWVPAEGTVYVFVSGARQQEPLHYGDVVESSVILRVPKPATNPGTFDWQAWLARQNIQFTATIRKLDTCRVLARHHGNPVIALSLRLRERFEQALHYGLEDEPELAGVLAGMVIGERSDIPADAYGDFQRTGVFHVFAISGLHVGLVTGVVLIGLRLVRIPRRWCGLVAIPLLILYVFASGARPGAVRALVMASVWLFGWFLIRPADALNSLAGAALGLLVWNPTELLDGGFILSFSVVIALVVLTPRIERPLRALISPDPMLPQALVPPWRKSIEPSGTKFVRLVSCAIASWVGLLPLMASYFHLFTPISILANVLVIPGLGLIIATGMGALVAYPVCPWLAGIFNNANFVLLGSMMRAVDWLGQVPFGHMFVQAPPAWLIWGYYIVAILLLVNRLPWPRWRLATVVAIPAVAAATYVKFQPARVVEVTVLDLSDGAAIFVDVPGERDDILIDGGGGWSASRLIIPFLRSRGVDRLGGIILTHGDKAHAGGLTEITSTIPVGQAVYSGESSRSKYYRQWLTDTRQANIPIRTLGAGETLALGEAVTLTALNPPRPSPYDRSDDNSLVLTLQAGPTCILLLSDAGEKVENRLLANPVHLPAQIILKGRHQIQSSCTEKFLDAVRPNLVVQAVPETASDRYPAPEQRDRLLRRGITMLRTDESGAVTIRLTDKGYTVRAPSPGE